MEKLRHGCAPKAVSPTHLQPQHGRINCVQVGLKWILQEGVFSKNTHIHISAGKSRTASRHLLAFSSGCKPKLEKKKKSQSDGRRERNHRGGFESTVHKGVAFIWMGNVDKYTGPNEVAVLLQVRHNQLRKLGGEGRWM